MEIELKNPYFSDRSRKAFADGVDEAQVDLWIDRVLDVATLDEVFAPR